MVLEQVLLAWLVMAPPTKEARAAELLKQSEELSAAAAVEIQAPALIEIAALTGDRKKALELLERAFRMADEVPPANRHDEDVRWAAFDAIAELDVEKGVEKVAAFPVDRRAAAAGRVAAILASQKRADRAYELISAQAGAGSFPYSAASAVIRLLPAGDGRRVMLFSMGVDSYQPRHNSASVARFIVEHAPEMPAGVAQEAAARVVRGVLDRKDQDFQVTVTMSSSKGAVSFDSGKDKELFELMHLFEKAAPREAASILEKRPGLRAALEKFPQGARSMKANEKENVYTSYRTSDKSDKGHGAAAEQMRVQALAESQKSEALRVAREDGAKGVEQARRIGVEKVRAETLALIAKLAAEKDPGDARRLLGQVVAAAKEVKSASDSAGTWWQVAEAARVAQDPEALEAALKAGVAACVELYKDDADAKRPNQAPREFWPSSQYFRSLVHVAGEALGETAEPYLAMIPDADLQLLARIELARALLGKPRMITSIVVSRPDFSSRQ
jgi:hypothetical protein